MKHLRLFEDFDPKERDEVDPEEKYYRGHTTYQERNADSDRDEEEDDDQSGDMDEAADPLEVTSKDTMRIQDIIKKAAGNMWKAKQLAETMCKLITTKAKAFRRGRAADMEKQHDLAIIFFRRAAELA